MKSKMDMFKKSRSSQTYTHEDREQREGKAPRDFNLDEKEKPKMKIDKLLPRKQQAASIRKEVIENPRTTKTSCGGYDLYHLTSQENETKGLLLQLAVFHEGGRFSLVLEGAASMGLSNNNYITFDEHYSDFTDLFAKAF